MKRAKIALESEVVKWLLQLIDSEQLLDSIDGQAEVIDVVVGTQQEAFIPTFSIDYVSRLASAKAAKNVLGQLGLLQLVAVNKSISLKTGEVLRPDILCFNPENRTLVVFEVKREPLTERQTLTELAGYEQELRNLLPFLGNFEICFVIVAKDWSTLLNHAIGSMNAWSGKQCLALKLGGDKASFKLTCHLPEAWHPRGSIGLPPKALQTIDLFLNEDGADLTEDFPPRLVLTAMDVIARAGDRSGSHGFMMLWKDLGGFGRGLWAITLCAVDPLAMYEWCRENGFAHRTSETAEYLDKQVMELPSLVPSVVYQMAREAFPVLSDRYQPEFDGAFSWEEKLHQYRSRGIPIQFEFWGMPGQYAREFVCNPGVRDHYIPYLSRHELDWTDPEIAIPLIDNLSGSTPFQGGVVRCSDAFKVGLAIGTLVLVASNASRSPDHAEKLAPLTRWADLEALRFAIEMKQIYDISNEVRVPMPTLSSSPELRLSSATALATWISDELIGSDHRVHQYCFKLGMDGVLLFSEWFRDGNSALAPDQTKALVEWAKHILGITLFFTNESASAPGSLWSQMRNVLTPHIRIEDLADETTLKQAIQELPDQILIDNFVEVMLPAIDSAIPLVLHTVTPMPAMTIDWDWLKSGAKASFEAGNFWHAVILSQNGTMGGGLLSPMMSKLLPPIKDPDIEVFFLNEKSAFSSAVKVTWADLIKNGVGGI